MPFLLSRGGRNVIAEVQRWQYFLRRQRFDQAGAIDGDFGSATERATKFFQISVGVPDSGKLDARTLDKAQALGYSVVPDDYYTDRAGTGYPARPAGLTSPSNASRNAAFGCFKFIQRPRVNRPDAEAITIKGSCDGAQPDWAAANIVSIEVPQLRFAIGYAGRVRCHRLFAPVVQQLFGAWEAADLLHLIRSYEGAFVERYIRGKAPPGSGGHGTRLSRDVSELSNHSFGSAFDINFPDNQLGAVPAECGGRGSVRELVEIANGLGIFWGGHFSRLDGMHFELSRV